LAVLGEVAHAGLEQVVETAGHHVALQHVRRPARRGGEGLEDLGRRAVQHHLHEDQQRAADLLGVEHGGEAGDVAALPQPPHAVRAGRSREAAALGEFAVADPPVGLQHPQKPPIRIVQSKIIRHFAIFQPSCELLRRIDVPHSDKYRILRIIPCRRPPMPFDTLDQAKFGDERAAVAAALAARPLSPEDREAVIQEAMALVRAARRSARRQGVVESFLQEFSLSTREGLALMCLAEALLRTPDEETRDKLIAEKIASADWASHAGNSDSILVNASTWSLMLTGKLIDPDEEAGADLPGFIRKLAGRLGEPVIRRAVGAAVRIMGEQFVLGATIEKAIKRAAQDGFVCSFDMLGEGARTEADADRYEAAYAAAIEVVGKHAMGPKGAPGPEGGHGVSVKLSALSPRYEARQPDRVWGELYPRIKVRALLAAKADINLTLDAEEADRLVISLELLEKLAGEQELGGW